VQGVHVRLDVDRFNPRKGEEFDDQKLWWVARSLALERDECVVIPTFG
jgi:hypothetical protein